MNITKRKQAQRYKNNLVVTSGERKWEEQDRGRGLRGTNSYV